MLGDDPKNREDPIVLRYTAAPLQAGEFDEALRLAANQIYERPFQQRENMWLPRLRKLAHEK